MLDSVDVDTAVHCKKIYDSLRCRVCDKGGGSRLRYSCGHTVCFDCKTSSCLICLTTSQSSRPVVDDVLNARVENAGNLLAAYQEFFSVDVYKKQKLCQKLKIEKQLFPDCIQAPVKYYNKRKTLSTSFQGKENQLQFLGEEVPLSNSKMDNKINLVKKWLANNEQIERKPLSDLSTNKQRIVDENSILLRNKITTSKKRKNSTVQSMKSKRQKSKRGNVDKKLYFKNKKTYLTEELDANMKISKQNIDFHDIVQPDDEPIIIDDTQVDIVDKDKEAWHMVLGAHEQTLDEKTNKSNNISSENDDKITKLTASNQYKIPFYKKSCLKDMCKFCNESVSIKDLNPNDNNEVTIVVTNNSFVTNIKVSKEYNSVIKNVEKKSIEVQTDSIQIKSVQNKNDKASLLCSNIDQINKTNTNNTPLIFSEDLFPEERPVVVSNPLKGSNYTQNVCNINANNGEHLVIVESDSDDSITHQHIVEVKADIHRSCNEFDYGVLSEVRDEAEHSRRRRPARGYTPDSSNSSEKENHHPNKPKRTKHDKKNTHKK